MGRRGLERSGIAYLLTLSGLLFGAFPAAANADTLLGRLELEGEPPFAGVAYIPDDDSRLPKSSLDQAFKMFTRRLVPTSTHSPIEFKNSDVMAHNIYAHDRELDVRFDLGLMRQGDSTVLRVDWEDDSLIELRCHIHPRMRSFLANIHASHYAVIDFDKGASAHEFRIDDAPDTAERLKVLLVGFDPIEVELGTRAPKRVAVSRDGQQVGSLVIERAAPVPASQGE